MKKTVRIYNILLMALFLGLIMTSFLNDLLRFYEAPATSQSENRNLAPKPVFDISYLDPYPKLYENYFNDHFPYRKELIFINTLNSFFVLNQSPLPDEVSLGTDGWLFFHQKESEVYQGKLTLTDWQVEMLVRDLHKRTLSYRKRGIRFYVAFPPMKHEIYSEYLPRTFMRSPGGIVTDKIVGAIRKDTVVQFIDLKAAMLESKRFGPLYYKTDNHWNWLGAFYGYSAVIGRIAKDFPVVKQVTRDDLRFDTLKVPPGNLAVMIGLKDYMTETDYIPTLYYQRARQLEATHQRPDWAKDIVNYESVRATGDTTLPTTVIIGDSYTDGMRPFFDESFNRTTYIFDGWNYFSNDVIIDDVKPEIVILLIFEPHISHLVRVW